MPSERTLRTGALVLALAGVAVATYIAIAEADRGAPVCVAGSGGCEQVADSEYADLLGVNVSVIGIGGYLILAAAALMPGDPGRFTGLLASVFGFGFSAYLTYLELFEIEAICQWCVASAALMTLLLLVNLMRASGYLGATAEAAGDSPG
ncbi:MAG TPA: vitamin K epoxide reductase family protein [Solirubrobacterales bacterium]|nr:vitamin K epoxide reductase family protein [Solirubrobacterales bacterium]